MLVNISKPRNLQYKLLASDCELYYWCISSIYMLFGAATIYFVV
jgi:hypothetical protein